MSYRYYLINRPPFIGTHPTGSNAREVWSPVRRIPDASRTAHGWVEYDAPLSQEEIDRYELVADNPAAVWLNKIQWIRVIHHAGRNQVAGYDSWLEVAGVDEAERVAIAINGKEIPVELDGAGRWMTQQDSNDGSFYRLR